MFQIGITVVIIAFTFGSISASNNHIQDHAIYKISCKADNGVLTVDSSSSPSNDYKVKVLPWNDGAGQKWKSKQPALAKSFEFKPTSNDKSRLDADDQSNVFAWSAPKQDTKYWYVNDQGENYYQIKNYKTGTCITSQGLNNPVKLMNCDNSPAQQWAFAAL